MDEQTKIIGKMEWENGKEERSVISTKGRNPPRYNPSPGRFLVTPSGRFPRNDKGSCWFYKCCTDWFSIRMISFIKSDLIYKKFLLILSGTKTTN